MGEGGLCAWAEGGRDCKGEGERMRAWWTGEEGRMAAWWECGACACMGAVVYVGKDGIE